MSRILSAVFVALMVTDAHGMDTNLFQLETKVAQNPLRLKIELRAVSPAKINQGAPLSVDIKAGNGVIFPKDKITQANAQVSNASELTWELPLTASGQKTYEISGHVSFYLCTDKWCRKFETDFIENFGEQIARVVH